MSAKQFLTEASLAQEGQILHLRIPPAATATFGEALQGRIQHGRNVVFVLDEASLEIVPATDNPTVEVNQEPEANLFARVSITGEQVLEIAAALREGETSIDLGFGFKVSVDTANGEK